MPGEQITWLKVISDPLIHHKTRVNAENHEHHKHIQETGTELSQCEGYRKALASIQPATDNEIAVMMGIPAARVSARRNKCIELKQVELAGHKTCRVTGYTVRAWQLTKQEKQ
jgi:hypothetical protein